jgi:hypothetical protein
MMKSITTAAFPSHYCTEIAVNSLPSSARTRSGTPWSSRKPREAPEQMVRPELPSQVHRQPHLRLLDNHRHHH